MDELILLYSGASISFDLYDYRCDKYTHEIVACVGYSNLKSLYKFADRNNKIEAQFILSSSLTDFNLYDCGISKIMIHDDFIEFNISISDISQYVNCEGLKQ